MDRAGDRQVPEGSGKQGKMEKTGCNIICGAPTTLAVEGLMIMMYLHLSRNCEGRWDITDDFTASFFHFSLWGTQSAWLYNKKTIRGLYRKGYNGHEFAHTHARNFTKRNNQGSVWKRLQQSWSLPIPMPVTLQQETIRGLYRKGCSCHDFAHAQSLACLSFSVSNKVNVLVIFLGSLLKIFSKKISREVIVQSIAV